MSGDAEPRTLPLEWGACTWPEAATAVGQACVAVLPVGAVEAHGPHLSLETDRVLARGVAEGVVQALRARGQHALVLPPLVYSVTDCASEFTGTISVRRSTASALLVDIGASLARQGVHSLLLSNAHLEPEHRASLKDALESLRELAPSLRVCFPDIVRRRYAQRLGAEFQSGACHAGQYETSLALAIDPTTVRTAKARTLPENATSIGQALADGAKTFREAGGPNAYFGHPAKASAEEGRELLATLVNLHVEALDSETSGS